MNIFKGFSEGVRSYSKALRFISNFMALFFKSSKSNILKNINNINNNSLDILNKFNDSLNGSINNSLVNYNSDSLSNSYSNTGDVSNKSSLLASDSDIQHSLLMTCKEKIPELDVCADICEDPNYKLRRLQRYDNELFK